MFSVLRKLPQVVNRSVQSSRNIYSYYGPPRQPLSIVETWAHGIAIFTGILAIPVWVLVHIKEYRGIDKQEQE